MTAVAEKAPEKARLYDEDAEKAVLGALIIQRDHTLGTELATVLEAKMFHRSLHRALYEAVTSLRTSNTAVDPVTISNALQAAGHHSTLEASKELVGELYDFVPTADHAKAHAKIVRDHYRRRELLDLSRKIAQQAADLSVDVDGAYDWASQALMQRARGIGDGGFEHIKESLRAAISRIEDREAGRVPIGVSTGLPELDAAMGGPPQPGNIVFVVGVPQCGKTSVVFKILMDGALAGRGASGFISAEMTREMLADSAIAAIGGVRRAAITSGQLSREERGRVIMAYADMAKAPIFLQTQPRPRIEDVITRCRLLKAQQPSLSQIGVDFLQLLQKRDGGRGELREQVYREIAYDLQGLAVELGVVMYVTVQPNSKQIASRDGDRRPRLADIAGSQGPEEAATIALLLYRAQIYDPSATDEIEIAVAKNKFGPSGRVARLRWEGHYVRATSEQREQMELEAKRERDRPLSLIEGATA
ncbi:MAG: replicative DNA helicase [Gemmatimonadaceae bacterium]